MPASPYATEATINAAESDEMFAKFELDLQERREKIRQDAEALTALDPDSLAYHELRTRIDQETGAADTLEDTAARARRALTSYRATARNAGKGAGHVQGSDVATAGMVVTVIAQGSTLMFAGVAVIVIGVLLLLTG